MALADLAPYLLPMYSTTVPDRALTNRLDPNPCLVGRRGRMLGNWGPNYVPRGTSTAPDCRLAGLDAPGRVITTRWPRPPEQLTCRTLAGQRPGLPPVTRRSSLPSSAATRPCANIVGAPSPLPRVVLPRSRAPGPSQQRRSGLHWRERPALCGTGSVIGCRNREGGLSAHEPTRFCSPVENVWRWCAMRLRLD